MDEWLWCTDAIRSQCIQLWQDDFHKGMTQKRFLAHDEWRAQFIVHVNQRCWTPLKSFTVVFHFLVLNMMVLIVFSMAKWVMQNVSRMWLVWLKTGTVNLFESEKRLNEAGWSVRQGEQQFFWCRRKLHGSFIDWNCRTKFICERHLDFRDYGLAHEFLLIIRTWRIMHVKLVRWHTEMPTSKGRVKGKFFSECSYTLAEVWLEACRWRL